MSWPAPGSNPAAGTAQATDLGPSVVVPPGSTLYVLAGAANGSIGDTIKAIRFTNAGGTATIVTLTDGDGTSYVDPNGSGNLVPNPYNAKQIQGASAAASVPDFIMYNQPSYSGSWKITTGANVTAEVFGNFS